MTALAICRFVHFMAAMLAFGASAYLWLYAPEAIRRELSPTIRGPVIAASVLALVTAILWLALEAASMADDWGAAVDPGTIAAVLTDTAFGPAWIVHLAFAVAFVAAAAFASRDRWGTIAILSGLTLASLALVGHAAMQSGVEGILHRVNHAAHLLTTGAWLGGLIPFVMCRDFYAVDYFRRDAVEAMSRFSFTGHFVVAAIIATGIVNIALISGHAPLPWTTWYRELLDIKIVVVVMMIVLAVFNRYGLTPRLGADTSAIAALRATSIAEVALGTAAVALVSVFGLLDPA
jgi:copper resistance protein D